MFSSLWLEEKTDWEGVNYYVPIENASGMEHYYLQA
jgi:hypothetical protein